MYAGLGVSVVVPVLHGVGLYGWAEMDRRMGLRWLAGVAGFNILGGAAYAYRVS